MRPTRRSAVRRGLSVLALAGLLAGSLAATETSVGAAGTSPSTAGQNPGEPHPKNLKEAGKDFLSDAGRIWSSPARVGNRTIFPLIAFAASTTFLIAGDESIRDGVQSYADDHPWVGDVAPVITQLGGLGGLAAAGAFFGAGLVFRDERARDTGYLATSAILQCMLVDNALKVLAGRQRPYVADGEDHWGGPAAFFDHGGEDTRAFPSGHSATAFALATVVSMQYRDTAWVPVVAYTLATGVGLSRMALDKHWASDVFVGAVIGHFVARLVVRDHARRSRLVPMLACSSRGVAISVFYDLDRAGR